jgi:hypothetical protein
VAQEQIIGNIGLVVGKVTNQKNEVLKAGDNIFFGDVIKTDNQSKSQVLLLDETVITLGEQTSITMDEFIYDPNDQSGKIVSTLLKGSIKVLSGKVSRGNPEDLVINTPAGSIGTRGTEFQTIVDEDEGTSKVLLIGPGENNSLGLRPGAVEVSNQLGSVVLDTPFSFTQFSTTQIPSPPIAITNEQLQQFQGFLDIRAEVIETETVAEAIADGLFSKDGGKGNELVGNIITEALNLSDGGLTFDEIAKVLGTSTEQLLGDKYQEEIQKETPENQKLMANAEGGDGLAHFLKYGGERQGDSTAGQFRGISSGTYTYTGNNINMGATKGVGSGTFSSVNTVDFASQEITSRYTGTVSLGGDDPVAFDHQFTTDYSSSSASTKLDANTVIEFFSLNKSTGEVTPTANSHAPSDYTVNSAVYRAESGITLGNVKFNGSSNSPIGSIGSPTMTVLNYDAAGQVTENSVNGQRTAIMPKRN